MKTQEAKQENFIFKWQIQIIDTMTWGCSAEGTAAANKLTAKDSGMVQFKTCINLTKNVHTSKRCPRLPLKV